MNLQFTEPASRINAEVLAEDLRIKVINSNLKLRSCKHFTDKVKIQGELTMQKEKYLFYKNYYQGKPLY
jgi:hypothetical protein